MTRVEYGTHFAMWSAVFASPLVLGFDPVSVPQWCVDLVTLPGLLALHHDEARVPGRLSLPRTAAPTRQRSEARSGPGPSPAGASSWPC